MRVEVVTDGVLARRLQANAVLSLASSVILVVGGLGFGV